MIHQKTRKTRALHLSPFEPVGRRSGSHWARADWAGRDPRSVPPFETKHRTMPPARHAAAGEAFALSEAAKGCRSGGGGSSGGGIVEDRAVAPAVAPPKSDDRENNSQAQQRADNGGEEDETQCGVRAKASALVTEPQLQCGSSGGGENDDGGDEGDDGIAAPSSFGEVGSI